MSAAHLRISALTSCTGQKVATAVAVPAERLYCGQQHVRLMRGVEVARSAGHEVAVAVVSAEHGLLGGDGLVAPYERTFQGMPAAERRRLARELGIPAAIGALLAEPADLRLVLLGGDYLDACELTADAVLGAPTLALCGAGTALRLPVLAGLRPLVLHERDTRRFACGLVGLKGEVAGRLLALLAERPDALADLLVDDAADPLERLVPVPRRRPAKATRF